MVEVMMGVDHVSKRFGRQQFLHFGDHAGCPQLMLGRLDQYRMVGELDQNAVVRLASQEPDPLADFFDLDHGRQGGGNGGSGSDIFRSA
jgi:hypothetical protein